MTKYIRFLPVLPLLCQALCGNVPGAPEDTMRKMIRKSLPYIEKRGQSWKNSKGCHSCHRTTFTIWSLNRAAEKGFAVDQAKLKGWNDWGRQWKAFIRKNKIGEYSGKDRETVLQRENSAVAQMLLGRPKGEDGDWVGQYRNSLAKGQKEDGSWEAGGQLPRQARPDWETTESNVMWVVLALADYTGKDSSGAQSAIGKALEWMGGRTQAQSTEWWVTKLLVERQLGTEEKAVALRKALLEKQNPDGGWGWLTGDSSDAFGTGFALYALAKEGIPISDPSIAKAIDFLASTQKKDGSWQVNGTKKDGRGEPVETAQYWGTCWAVIGLLEFLEDF